MGEYKYLIGKNELNEGYSLILNSEGNVGELNIDTYTTIVKEGKRASLEQPFHVYARYEVYQSKNIVFHKITDENLVHLNFDGLILLEDFEAKGRRVMDYEDDCTIECNQCDGFGTYTSDGGLWTGKCLWCDGTGQIDVDCEELHLDEETLKLLINNNDGV